MEVLNQKNVIRKEKKACRDALTAAERTERSQKICEALWQMPVLQEAERIYCYAPVGSEADIMELAERLWSAGKRLAFPRVIDAAEKGYGMIQDRSEQNRADRESIEFYEVKDRGALAEGAFHVPEPVMDGRAPVDWKGAPVLVPGVAFSASGARCGYGKGCYDRYFAAHPELVRIGIAFECQLSEELPACCEATDERLDYVQTERRCYAAVDAMSYEQMVEKISTARRFGSAPGVVCSAAAMELLGHPERSLTFVHIAGTNGKGSVAAFLREICEKAGLRAGLFTSPHLQEFTERIQVGHAQIPREKVLQLWRIVMETNHRLMASQGINLTMFDYCFAIALLYMKEQKVDLVILETGMGGRLDSTNMIPPPVLAVITGIGLEHTGYLGNTVEAIASEKAGILKRGTQAVLMGQDAPALDVLKSRCRELSVPYQVSGSIGADGYYQGVHYEIGMQGAYQRKNAAAAIEAARLLAQNGFPQITQEAVGEGIRDARWQGRMEVVSEHPWVLLDGAHNVHGVTALAQSLREIGGNIRYTFFMGVMADKDYEAMAELILPLAKHIYTLTPDSTRALPAEKLCAFIRARGGSADTCADVAQLVKLIQAQPEDEKIVVFGSLYLIGEVRGQLEYTQKGTQLL